MRLSKEKEAWNKVSDVINSCERMSHLLVAFKMIMQFDKLYNNTTLTKDLLNELECITSSWEDYILDLQEMYGVH